MAQVQKYHSSDNDYSHLGLEIKLISLLCGTLRLAQILPFNKKILISMLRQLCFCNRHKTFRKHWAIHLFDMISSVHMWKNTSDFIECTSLKNKFVCVWDDYCIKFEDIGKVESKHSITGELHYYFL